MSNLSQGPFEETKQKGLPSYNLAQQLFNKELPSCAQGAPCCKKDNELNKWYTKTPQNIWNTASNYEGEPPFSQCTDIAFTRQCFLSQYFNYLSKNNGFGNETAEKTDL